MKSYEERMRDERDEAIADLDRQVAALTKERDELETECAAHAACTKYRVEQLAAVVQQRDELLKSMKYLQEYRLWVNGHAKTIIDSAIAKVQP